MLLVLLVGGLEATYCTGEGPEGCTTYPPPECYSHDDCPKGLRCDLHPVPDADPNQCVDRTESIGSSCDPGSCVPCICNSEVVCVPSSDAGSAGRGTCQLDCTSDDDCPDGYTCALTEDGIVDYCVLIGDGGA